MSYEILPNKEKYKRNNILISSTSQIVKKCVNTV